MSSTLEVWVEGEAGEESCGSSSLTGRKFRPIRIKTTAGIEGRWLFVNGTKRPDRITVRFFHKGLPLWKHVTDGGEVRKCKRSCSFTLSASVELVSATQTVAQYSEATEADPAVGDKTKLVNSILVNNKYLPYMRGPKMPPI